MIIGNGDIASVLPDREDLLFFASGVSNSQETKEEAYRREIDLLLSHAQSSGYEHIVYFSSLCIFYDNKGRYALHKNMMEQLIRSNFPQWTIIRIGNITWGDNPYTLLNFMRNKINKKEQFEIKDEYRYLVDKEEFLHWIALIPEWNAEMNITGNRMKVADIVALLQE